MARRRYNLRLEGEIDEDGNFTGELFSNGKKFTVEEWNSNHLSKPAANDFDEQDRMSND